MKQFASVLMRVAQIKLAVGLALLLVVFLTGNFHSSSIFFIMGFALVQASFYLYLIGIFGACVVDTQQAE